MPLDTPDTDPYLVPKSDPNREALADPRVKGFLDKISKSEGADYNTLVGGRRINDLSRHPNIVGLTTSAGPSTAFGRYQITGTTNKSKLAKYKDLDYSPENQDLRAVELLRQTKALDALQADDEPTAVRRAGHEWASLPGSTLPGRKRPDVFKTAGRVAQSPQDPYLVAKSPSPEPADDPYLVAKPDAPVNIRTPIQGSGRAAAMARTTQQPAQPSVRRFGEGQVRQLTRKAADPANPMGGVTAGVGGEQGLAVQPSSARSLMGGPQLTVQPTALRQSQRPSNASRVRANTTATDAANTAGAGLRSITAMTGSPTQLLPNAAQDWINSAITEGGAGLVDFAAGMVRHGIPALEVAKSLGAPDVLQGPVADRLHRAATEMAATGQAVDAGARRGAVSEAAHGLVAGSISSAPGMALAALGVPAPIAFGLQSNLESQGRDAELSEIIKDTAGGAALGALFELPVPAKVALLGKVAERATKAGIVGAGSFGLGKLQGQTNQQAGTGAIINAAFAGSGAPEREGVSPKAETQTVVPNIDAQLAAREAAVKPTTDAQGNVLLNADEYAAGGKMKVRLFNDRATVSNNLQQPDARTVNAIPNVDMRTQSASNTEISPPRRNAGEVEVVAGSTANASNPTQEVSPQSGAASETVSPSLRHVDLIPRRSRNTESGKRGQFKAETPAQAEARRAQVEQASQPSADDALKALSDFRFTGEGTDVEHARYGELSNAYAQAKAAEFFNSGGQYVEPKARVTLFSPEWEKLTRDQREAVLSSQTADDFPEVRKASQPASEPALPTEPATSVSPTGGVTAPSTPEVQPEGAKNEIPNVNNAPNRPEETQTARGVKTPEPLLGQRTGSDQARGRLVSEGQSSSNPKVEAATVAPTPATDPYFTPERSGDETTNAPRVNRTVSVTKEQQRATTSRQVAPSVEPEPAKVASDIPNASERDAIAGQRDTVGQWNDNQRRSGKVAPERSTTSARKSQLATDRPTTTGIAHRIETVARGAEPARGEGIGARESVERGRQLLRDGTDPQTVIDKFKTDGAISAESMAVVRARHEELARDANRAYDTHGLNSPEFKSAESARQSFYDTAVKPMQTAWSNTGRAQQGETAIDTGTFYGLYRAFKDTHAREPTPREQSTIRNLSTASGQAESAVTNLTSQLTAELNKAANLTDLPPEVRTAVKRFIDQSARETRRTGRQATRKSLDDEAAPIKSNLASAFQKVKSQSGIQPSGLARLDPEGEITKQLIAYAKNRAKAGITDAAQLIDDVHAAVSDFADVSKREVAEAILGAGLPKSPRTESEWAKVKSGVRQVVSDYTTEDARASLGARLQGGKVSPADAADIWAYTRTNYIDQGNHDFADVTRKVASDLGITPDQVRRSLASTRPTKRLSDEMWKQMADRRQARQNAESWVAQADANPAYKAFESARRLFFLTKTAGHGAVAPFTHAPVNAFIPTRAADFWRNFGRTYQFMVSKGGHERAMVDLENSPNFTTAKRAGLANDPKRGYDEYQSPWMAKSLGKLGVSGNRAFDSLKTMRQDMFDSVWERMPKADQTPEMAKVVAQEINSSTGASRALSGGDWVSRGLSKAMFAAPLEASRWEFLVRDNARALDGLQKMARGKATPEERYTAKRVVARNAQLVATYGTLLALNQGLLSATNSDDKINYTDPTKSDFLAFKLAGRTISPASGMLTALRFVGTLASQAKDADLKKPKQAVEDMAKTTFNYGRSKLSPLFGTAGDIALRSDYSGRPLPISRQEGTDTKPRYNWPEYLLSQQTPIPFGEAVRDVYNTMREQGMGDRPASTLLQALAKAVPVAAVAATGIRMGVSYQSNPAQLAAAANQDRATLKRGLEDRARAGEDVSSEVKRLVQSGKLNPKDPAEITREAKLTRQQLAFKQKGLEEALDQYEHKMTAQQQSSVKNILSEKAKGVDLLALPKQPDVRRRLQSLGFTAPVMRIERPDRPDRPSRPNPRAWGVPATP